MGPLFWGAFNIENGRMVMQRNSQMSHNARKFQNDIKCPENPQMLQNILKYLKMPPNTCFRNTEVEGVCPQPPYVQNSTHQHDLKALQSCSQLRGLVVVLFPWLKIVPIWISHRTKTSNIVTSTYRFLIPTAVPRQAFRV